MLSAAVLGLLAVLPLVFPGDISGRAFLVETDRLTIEHSPDWLEPEMAASVKSAIAPLGPFSLRDGESVESVVQQMVRSSGWIREAHRVTKRYPNQLVVELDLRRPLAMVRSLDGLVLVDAEGVVLGPAAEAPDLVQGGRLPLILASSGALVDTTPREAIRDEAVRQGVAAAAELQPHQERLRDRGVEIAVIRVRPPARRSNGRISEVDLFTLDGLCVEWGRPAVGKLAALEPEAEVKVGHLIAVAAKYPDFAGIRLVRVQFERFEDVSVEIAEDPVHGWAPMTRSDSFLPSGG